jgi:hypothetical protein
MSIARRCGEKLEMASGERLRKVAGGRGQARYKEA